MDYLVVSWVAAALAEEAVASWGVSLADFLTLSDLERCSASPAGTSRKDREALLLGLNSRLVCSSTVGPVGLA